MSIDLYPRTSYWLIASGPSVNLGSYTNAIWGDLALVQLRVYSKNPNAYSYQMRIVVSATQGGTALVASDYCTFSNATTLQTTSDWLGDVNFDIPPYAFINTETYFFRLEIVGYTRANTPLENTQYIGVWCDWMQRLGNTNTAAARLAIGVNR